KLYSHDTLNPFKLELLKKWIDHDLDLGNHTYSHPDYNTVSVDHYTRDILKGETISKKLLADKHKPLRYFRHPFLHVGQTKEKADSLKAFLAQANYTVAPVTIDNEDYLFAVAYHRARVKNDTSLMLQIGHDFIDYLEKKIIYYEKISHLLFGRPISQIFLLHASLLNSIYTDSLTIMLKKNHYDFISMDDALKDSAYQTEIMVYSDWGISWIDRWALSQGKKGDFFKDDPVTPDYIKELAK
nr:polysaccharide deacetylase family protein [Candidatus Delongbacteria bacterium]